jgi:hypothetical protein
MLAAVSIYAYIPSRYYQPGIFTFWSKTDTSLKVNVDTANALTRAYIKRLADSVVSLKVGSPVFEEVQFTGTANFSNATNDSINLPIDGGVWNAKLLLYNMYADRAQIATDKPAAANPNTWRQDLPIVTTDSALIFRLSRNASFAAGTRIGLTIYKVAKGAGLSFTKTSGTFYDMARFDEAIMNTAGTSTQVNVQISLKKRR